MVKAVIFDLYETLVTQSGTAVPRAGALGESLGLDPTAYRREWKRLRPQVLCGQLTFGQALIEAARRLDVALPAERVQRACDERARANVEAATSRAEACVSGRSAIAWRKIGTRFRSALAPQFACAVFSYAAGCVKPDPRIYQVAIGHLGVSPAETVYIGDGGDDELAGAQRGGVHAAQAGWFVSRAASFPVPLLGKPQDVLRLVAGL